LALRPFSTELTFRLKRRKGCILGRNGEGKSTLLKLIGGLIKPDSGTISIQKGLSLSGLSQDLPQGLYGTVHEVVSGGLTGVAELLEEYRRLSKRIALHHDEAILKRITISMKGWTGSTGGRQAGWLMR
jgi:ATPase subunit of ABC transporter with duplicated ATPase domains